jgi:hypothetical protein
MPKDSQEVNRLYRDLLAQQPQSCERVTFTDIIPTTFRSATSTFADWFASHAQAREEMYAASTCTSGGLGRVLADNTGDLYG